ncbi:hypothetical protein ACFFQW_33070 [Umezawaea endophytica]|uniref:Uncharacterized protein n=1 Tax=Umezawaea endophytica TaxID=1654476 RepID=A0A9X2VV80_9PSEU|nr:hypothetical protein [Umezawaea endophytica]MCS7482273.1 hypothetical protein [Umezawaea endophytica]
MPHPTRTTARTLRALAAVGLALVAACSTPKGTGGSSAPSSAATSVTPAPATAHRADLVPQGFAAGGVSTVDRSVAPSRGRVWQAR